MYRLHGTCIYGIAYNISDASFLIRYLRTAKWSQLEGLNRLESYLRLFDIMPQMIRDIDMTDPKMITFLKTGYDTSLLKRLQKIILSRMDDRPSNISKLFSIWQRLEDYPPKGKNP